MKEKIIAAIKRMFPSVNLSKKRLEAIAAKIEAKVIDDETKIDAAITTYDEYNPLVDIAKQDDTIRNLEAKAKTTPSKKDDPTVPIVPAVPVITDDTPEWAKAIIEQNKLLAAGFAVLQGEKISTTMRQKATDKLKDVPATYWGKRPLPDKEEDIDAFVADVQADYTAFKKELTEAGISVLSVPKSGEAPDPKTTTVSPEIKAFAEKQAAQQKVEKAA
jgi:hypothetical protein